MTDDERARFIAQARSLAWDSFRLCRRREGENIRDYRWRKQRTFDNVMTQAHQVLGNVKQ